MTGILDRAISPAEAVAKAKPGFAYFLANFDADVVKIGFASNLDVRLSSIQTGNHADLSLIYSFRGCERSERLLHAHFSEDRVRGEWFRYTEVVDALIEDIESYRDHWAGGNAWPDEYFMTPDETAFVLSMIDQAWVCPTTGAVRAVDSGDIGHG